MMPVLSAARPDHYQVWMVGPKRRGRKYYRPGNRTESEVAPYPPWVSAFANILFLFLFLFLFQTKWAIILSRFVKKDFFNKNRDTLE